MMRSLWVTVFAVVLLVLSVLTPASTRAQDGATELRAVITAVRGLVQIRDAEDQPWKKAEVGMQLGEGGEFRTGPRSAVQFTIPPDQTVTLDRLGTVKLLTAVKEAGKIKTDLGMAYGRTRYDIRAGGEQEYESTIRSPSATLAIRGTQVGIQDGAFGYFAWSTQSRGVLRDRGGMTKSFGAGTGVTSSSRGPGQQGMQDATVDPGDSRARDSEESSLVTQRPAGDVDNAAQGFLGNDELGGNLVANRELLTLAQLADLSRISASQASRTIEGDMQIELFWQTMFPSDLDFYVQSPLAADAGKLLGAYGGLSNTVSELPSGGKVDPLTGDDTDGSAPTTGDLAYGLERVYWTGRYPRGKYSLIVDPFNLGENSSVSYQLRVNIRPPNQTEFSRLLTIEDQLTSGSQQRITDVTIGAVPTSSMSNH